MEDGNRHGIRCNFANECKKRINLMKEIDFPHTLHEISDRMDEKFPRLLILFEHELRNTSYK